MSPNDLMPGFGGMTVGQFAAMLGISPDDPRIAQYAQGQTPAGGMSVAELHQALAAQGASTTTPGNPDTNPVAQGFSGNPFLAQAKAGMNPISDPSQFFALMQGMSNLSQRQRDQYAGQLASITGGQGQANQAINAYSQDPNWSGAMQALSAGRTPQQVMDAFNQENYGGSPFTIDQLTQMQSMMQSNGGISRTPTLTDQLIASGAIPAPSGYTPPSGGTGAGGGSPPGTGTPPPSPDPSGSTNDAELQWEHQMQRTAMESQQYNPNGANTWAIQNTPYSTMAAAFNLPTSMPGGAGTAVAQLGSGSGNSMSTPGGISQQTPLNGGTSGSDPAQGHPYVPPVATPPPPPPPGSGSNAGGGNNRMPGYARGTNFVPRTGPAFLHKGEAVVPAHMNPATFFGGATAPWYQQGGQQPRVNPVVDPFPPPGGTGPQWQPGGGGPMGPRGMGMQPGGMPTMGGGQWQPGGGGPMGPRSMGQQPVADPMQPPGSFWGDGRQPGGFSPMGMPTSSPVGGGYGVPGQAGGTLPTSNPQSFGKFGMPGNPGQWGTGTVGAGMDVGPGTGPSGPIMNPGGSGLHPMDKSGMTFSSGSGMGGWGAPGSGPSLTQQPYAGGTSPAQLGTMFGGAIGGGQSQGGASYFPQRGSN